MMKVIDLPTHHVEEYCQCLEEWSPEIREAGDQKRRWYETMKDHGLRVKVSVDENGTLGGMIQYAPIEYSFASGEGLYFVFCIWVHGYSQGRGNFQKKGMGSALLQAAEEDARALGAKGIAAWGMSLPVFMRASWFRKHGYRVADRMGMQQLLWKSFLPEATAPKWIRQQRKPHGEPDKVVVTSFRNGWCPGMNTTCERAGRAAASLGEKVVFQVVDTAVRETFLSWGISDALFINEKQVRTGPPPSYARIAKQIAKQVGWLNKKKA
jgi:GNAT superfamily N-acetyltransferase